MTQMDLFQIQIQGEQSLQPDTHVSHFHLPGSEVAAKMTATSGRTFFPLFKPDDRLGAFSKMFMGMSLWASTKCFLTWNVKPTPQGRSLFQLVPSTPTIEETGSGSSQKMWRTPDTGQGGTSGLLKQGKTHRENGQPIQVRLVNQINNPKLWPTPTAQDSSKATKKWRDNHQNNLTAAVFNPQKMWPTPAASDYKGAPKNRFMGSETYRSNLCEAVRENLHSAHLNPDWVEWLMGYPTGWTNLQASPEPPAQQKDAPQGSKD